MNAPMQCAPRAEPFFFDAEPGTRFSLYHAPSPQVALRGAILYVHPFADELNHARRMAALQSRRFAAMGYAVLQIDLFGCGDSCGDFHTARWDQWKRDLSLARDWLAARSPGPLYLWGLRLGGLLALDFAATSHADGIILWQPFLHGRACINQFLRQGRTVGYSSRAVRAELVRRGTLEVAGYELALPLVRAIDACDAATIALPPCPVHWFASGASAPRRLAAAATRLQQRWAGRGVTLHVHPLAGVPFWSGSPGHCPALLDATGAVFAASAPEVP